MRMLGLGLLAVILAGAAVVLSYLGADGVAQKVQNYIQDPDLTFETAEPQNGAQAGDKGDKGVTSAVTLRAEPRQAMILSGVPSYQGAKFLLPFDARPVSGVLHVDLTSQALGTTDAALRVSIDNARRAEVLLNQGVEDRSFDIALTEADLARGVLPVSFSLQGRGSDAPCAGPGIGAVVEVKPTTRLELVLDGPVTTPRDQVIAWGGAVRADWPTGISEAAERLAVASDLIRNDYSVTFLNAGMNAGTPGAFGLDQLQAMLDPGSPDPLPLLNRQSAHYDFPVDVAAMSGNDGVKRFHRSLTWRSRFDAGSLPEGEVPGTLDLALKLGPLPDERDWIVDVTLNGHLAIAESVPGNVGDYRRTVTLPEIPAGEAAALEITLTTDDDMEGICNEGPELLAELLPDTQLQGRAAAEPGLLVSLRAEISDQGLLQVRTGTDLTAAEAAGAARLIAAIGPGDVPLQAVEVGAVDAALPQAVALAGGALPDAKALKDAALEQWVIWSDADTGRLHVQSLDQSLEQFGGLIWPVSVLVDLPQPGGSDALPPASGRDAQ